MAVPRPGFPAVSFTAIVAFCTLLFSSTFAFAFTPPPIDGPITDAAGKLSDSDKQTLSEKLRTYKATSGNEITFFIAASLNGEDIADVANDTARAWKLGTKEKQKDVLVVIAPNERKDRIETAKGADGDLTDLQTAQIRQATLEPRLKADDFRGAIDQTTDAIIGALGDAASGKTPAPAAGQNASFGSVLFFIILIVIVFLIVRAINRRGGGGGGGGPGFFWFGGGGGGFGGGGSSGGGGGGDWGGGGGGWGGGGSSGSY